MEKFRPEEIKAFNASRAKSDAELARTGADIELSDEGKYRLLATPEQIEKAKREMESDTEQERKMRYATDVVLRTYKESVAQITKSLGEQIEPVWPGQYQPRVAPAIRLQIASRANEIMIENIDPETVKALRAKEAFEAAQWQGAGTPVLHAGEKPKEVDPIASAKEKISKINSRSTAEELRAAERSLREAAVWSLQFYRKDGNSKTWAYLTCEILAFIKDVIQKNRAFNCEEAGFLEAKDAFITYAGAVELDRDRDGFDHLVIGDHIDAEKYLKNLAQTEAAYLLSRYDIKLPDSLQK